MPVKSGTIFFKKSKITIGIPIIAIVTKNTKITGVYLNSQYSFPYKYCKHLTRAYQQNIYHSKNKSRV